MRILASALTLIAIACWFGGLVTLALSVMAVFRSSGLDRPVAGQATAAIFVWFGYAQLAFAAVALIGAFLGYLHSRRKVPMILFALLALATVAAAVFSAYLIPKIEELRKLGQSQSPQFKDLHRQSSYLVQAVTAVLLIAVLMLPAFFRAVGIGPKLIDDDTAKRPTA